MGLHTHQQLRVGVHDWVGQLKTLNLGLLVAELVILDLDWMSPPPMRGEASFPGTTPLHSLLVKGIASCPICGSLREVGPAPSSTWLQSEEQTMGISMAFGGNTGLRY